MSVIDRLFLNSVSESIKREIDREAMSAIEKKMGIDLGLKIEDLVSKFDEIKKSLFEYRHVLDDIEDGILRNFLTAEIQGPQTWLLIKNRHLTETILKTFADEEKKMILDTMRDKAVTTPNILTACKIPNTSAYRKVNQLIDQGFIVPVGLAESFEGKRAILYKSVIDRIQVNIDRNSIVAKMLIPQEMFRASSLVQTMLEMSQGSRVLSN